MNHKAPHNPYTLTSSLHSSHIRTLTNTEARSNLSQPLPFLLPSLPGLLFPQISIWSTPSSPAWLYSNVTFSVRHFQAVKFTVTPPQQNFLSLPFFIFFNALLLHKQSIFHQEVEEIWIIPEKSHFVTLSLLLPFHRDYTKLRCLTLSASPGNRALNQSNGLKLKIIFCLNGAHFPTPSLKGENSLVLSRHYILQLWNKCQENVVFLFTFSPPVIFFNSILIQPCYLKSEKNSSKSINMAWERTVSAKTEILPG